MDTDAARSEDRDPTWRYPWPAGQRLADDLPHLLDWHGRRVAELGCGCGLVGRRAAAAGAALVLMTDISPEPLEALASEVGPDPRFLFAQVAWGEPLPFGPYDVLLGGDILYRPAFFGRLAATLAGALAPEGIILLSDPRTQLEPDLFTALTAHGLRVGTERRPGPYTLVRAAWPTSAQSFSATVS